MTNFVNELSTALTNLVDLVSKHQVELEESTCEQLEIIENASKIIKDNRDEARAIRVVVDNFAVSMADNAEAYKSVEDDCDGAYTDLYELADDGYIDGYDFQHTEEDEWVDDEVPFNVDDSEVDTESND